MGLLDFFKKGEEKPAPTAKPAQPIPSKPVAGTSLVAPAVAKPQFQEYVIKSGDSLSKIAKQFLGDGNKWTLIYEANKDTIKNPDLIHPGQKIKIPTI